MKKLNVRIDERLIHGQVATMWTNLLNIQRIIVVDDEVIKSTTEKEVLKMAKPASVKLSILSERGASERIVAGKYDDENVLILVKNPLTILSLVNNGVNVEEIIVGNLSKKEGGRVITRSININKEDENAFEELNEKGIKIYSQMVPNDAKKDFIKLMKEV